MEDKENKEFKDECSECKFGGCPECGHGHGHMHGHMWCHHCHHGFRFVRLIIGFLILVFVFWAGFKLGELKSLMFYGADGARSLPGGYVMMWHGGQSGLENGWGPAASNLYGKNFQPPTSSVQ